MKSTCVILIVLAVITISCSDEQVVLERPPVGEEEIGGKFYGWSISQKGTDDHIHIEVGSRVFEGLKLKFERKIYLRKEASGEIWSSSADISEEDWSRIEKVVPGVFPDNPFEPRDEQCNCCDETLSYGETFYYMYYACHVPESVFDSKRIEGCTDEDTELIRELFQELKESYFPGENN